MVTSLLPTRMLSKQCVCYYAPVSKKHTKFNLQNIQETITMNNMNNIIKALVESVIGGLLLALLLVLMKDITFVQAITAPATIVAVVSAFIGSCIGFQRKARKQGQA
jgi:uncharacterized protein YacL